MSLTFFFACINPCVFKHFRAIDFSCFSEHCNFSNLIVSQEFYERLCDLGLRDCARNVLLFSIDVRMVSKYLYIE